MAASLQAVQDLINKAISDFDKQIPTLQRDLLDSITDELRNLDLAPDGTIETSVNNIKLFGTIKGQLNSLILNDGYIDQVKEFTAAFTQVATLQNQYWTQVESTFQPSALLDEIKKQSIDTTISSLTENGISANISDEISQILQTNIGSGGSMKQLEQQLRDSLTSSNSSDGLLQKYTRQITTDAINQFSRNYTKIVSDDLDYEWYSYRGSDIVTTRPFCWAVTALRYFHDSQVPALLRAEGLVWTNPKTGKEEPVPIYQKTGLPQGMYAGENPVSFYILAGGYNCGHQIGPVSEALVPEDIKDEIYSSPAYTTWAQTHPDAASVKANAT